MTMRWPAKLIGGRFDGDRGMLICQKLPPRLWAFACSNGASCQVGGVHWTDDVDAAAAEPGATEYAFHQLLDGDETGVAIYVWSASARPDELAMHVGCDVSAAA